MITKEDLERIVELTNNVPEEYRQKCFEILLEYTLRGTQQPKQNSIEDKKVDQLGAPPLIGSKPSLSLDVRAFFSTYGLDENIIGKFFLIEGEQIRHIYKLKAPVEATRRVHHALMLCLENAILNGSLQNQVENLRQRCVATGCYDESNFHKVFKRNEHLFTTDAKVEMYSLTPDGKSELANLLESLLE